MHFSPHETRCTSVLVGPDSEGGGNTGVIWWYFLPPPNILQLNFMKWQTHFASVFQKSDSDCKNERNKD
jgi:hypothetical protein